MAMKTKVLTLFTLLTITALLLGSCKPSAASRDEDALLAVAVKTQHLSDTSSFALSSGERCTIVADASIDYPVAGADGVAVDSLQRLFAAYVLEAADSLSLSQALSQVVTNSMHQYDFMDTSAGDVEPTGGDVEPTLNYVTSTRVTPVYNRNGVVTFERVDVVKKNGKVTSVTHRYYSFDVESQSYIDLQSLFRDDAMADVRQLLRQQLLKQNNATGNEQLNDLGYFNVENIMVTCNFCFGDNDMTWSFLPSELAVEAVGEPRISIPYGDLEPLLCDNSIIKRLN